MKFSFRAMWNYKCPRCRKGDLYKKPLVISNPLDMNKRCEHCDLDFYPQPGYYYGAMFLSYITSSWFLLLICLGLVFGLGWSVNAAMVLTIFVALISFLRFLRGSRSLWLHITTKYDERYAKEH